MLPLLLIALSWSADLERSYVACRSAERAGDWAEAHSHCTSCAAADPGGSRARFCSGRLVWLEERRDSDRDWGALTALEAVRRGAGADGVGRVRAIVANESASTTVRAEAAIWLGRRWLAEGRPEAAAEVLASRWSDVDALPEAVGRQLTETYALALAEAGRIEEARAVEARIRIETTAPRPTRVDRVERERWRAQLTWGAASVVGVFVLLSLPAAVRGWRLRPLPLGLVPIGLATLGAWLIAEGWEVGLGAPVPWIGLGLAAVHLVAVGALAHAQGAYRVALRGLAAVASLGVAWLAVWATGSLDVLGW